MEYIKAVNGIPWNQRFYLKLERIVHPFEEPHLFRPLNRAYNGNATFWSTPSPEPNLNNSFWKKVQASFNHLIFEAAQKLASAIIQWQPNPEKIVFVSILRAGVPITEWLCQMLPGSVGAALSLFVGIGIDKVALSAIEKDFPNRTIIFVDGWTGKGGVSREIAKLNRGPLAVLIDPWGWADFAGTMEDIFCPSACFTGVATLGFSRTFFVEPYSLYSAYRFPKEFAQVELVRNWKNSLPKSPSELFDSAQLLFVQSDSEQPLLVQTDYKQPLFVQSDIDNKNTDSNKTRKKRFHADTVLRLHSNEVCRALINASPEVIFFADDKHFVQEHFSLIVELADQRGIAAEFNVSSLRELKTRVACKLDIFPK